MPPKKKAPATTPTDITTGFKLTTPSSFSLTTTPQAKGGPITAPMPDGPGPSGERLPVETESDEEQANLQEAFYDAKRKDAARRSLHQAADYYINLVFATRDDAQKFIDQVGVPVVAFNCVDGYLVAKKLGLNIPFAYIPEPNVNILDSWADIALPITDPLHRNQVGPLVPPEPEPSKKPAKKAAKKK